MEGKLASIFVGLALSTATLALAAPANAGGADQCAELEGVVYGGACVVAEDSPETAVVQAEAEAPGLAGAGVLVGGVNYGPYQFAVAAAGLAVSGVGNGGTYVVFFGEPTSGFSVNSFGGANIAGINALAGLLCFEYSGLIDCDFLNAGAIVDAGTGAYGAFVVRVSGSTALCTVTGGETTCTPIL